MAKKLSFSLLFRFPAMLQEGTKSNVCIIFNKGKMGGRQVRDNGALATSERSR